MEYTVNDENKLLLLKTLVITPEFLNDLINAFGQADPEQKIKDVLADKNFAPGFFEFIAEMDHGKPRWKLNLSQLRELHIEKFIPQGVIGYY